MSFSAQLQDFWIGYLVSGTGLMVVHFLFFKDIKDVPLIHLPLMVLTWPLAGFTYAKYFYKMFWRGK